MSFGIYLVHFVLVGAVYRLFGMLHLLFLPASLSIPLLTAATCLAAWGNHQAALLPPPAAGT